MNSTIQYILYLTVLTALAIPLGGYIARAITGRPVLLSRVLRPCEDGIYRALNIDPCEEMGWKKYLLSAWRSWRARFHAGCPAVHSHVRIRRFWTAAG